MPRDPIPLSEIVSTGEIAAFYGVGEMTVRQWFRRYSPAPEPILSIGTSRHSVAIYDMQEIKTWLEERGPRNLEHHKRRASSSAD